jgi:putative PIN family toxin of toxin-antitoxin system
MRVILDTNILVSGFLWSGPSRQILDAARQGEIQLFTTQVLLDELANVLRRDKFATRLKRAGVSSNTLVTGFKALANLIEPQNIPPTILDDPDDDAVLACAIAAKAQAIVSGDSHLLKLGVISEIPILTATDLLKQLDR